MRMLQLAAYAFLLYLAARAILRWLLQGRPRGEPASTGGEMVLDPQCRAYVLKERAVTRRLGGETVHFCGEVCAAAYELERRG